MIYYAKKQALIIVILVLITLGATVPAQAYLPFYNTYSPYSYSFLNYQRPLYIYHYHYLPGLTQTVTKIEYKPVPVRNNSFWHKLGRFFGRAFKGHSSSLVRGAVGAVGIAGGLALINHSKYLARHPMERRGLKGVVIGGGIGLTIAKRATLPGAVIGAAVGIATHVVLAVVHHPKGASGSP